MQFIKFRDGTRVRSDMILWVTVHDACNPIHNLPAVQPRMIVNYGLSSNYMSSIFYYETLLECQQAADEIMLLINEANRLESFRG